MLSYTRLAHDLGDAATSAGSRRRRRDPAPRTSTRDADADAAPTPPEVADDELPPGIDSGLFLHDVLEHVDLAGARRAADAAAWLARPDVAALLADAARERGIDRRFLPHAARLVARAR